MTNTTDLATIATQLPAHLRAAQSGGGSEFSGGIAAGLPLAFLSVRGKEFRLRKDGQEFNTRQRDMSVIFIASRHTLSKRFYKDKYVTGSVEAPDCSSPDAITPDVAEPVHPNCQHCPMNQWGSRITENGKEGKACNDYKRTVVWPVGLAEEPVILDVSPTSLKAPKGQKHTVLMLGDYLGQLAKHGMDPTQVVTKMSFTDAEYPQLCFTFERFVTEEEWARVQELRESDDVSACLDENTYETQGPITETDTIITDSEPAPEPAAKPKTTRKPKPKPEPKPDPIVAIPAFPGVVTIMKNGDAMVIAQDTGEWNDAWSEGYRPQATSKLKEKAPAAEVQPEEAPGPDKRDSQGEVLEEAREEAQEEAAPATSDLLSEVAALLGKK